MRDQVEGSISRLQFDTEGQVVGTLFKAPFGQTVLMVKQKYLLLKMPETGRLRLWDSEHNKLVELARDERRDETSKETRSTE